MIAPDELRERQQWLLWRFEPNPKKPEGKKLKVPYYVAGRRRVGTQGDAKDRASLSTYQGAVDALARSLPDGKGKPDGIGFAFLPGDGLIGIDLDGILDAGTGEMSARAVAIVKACDSYTEWSPSKRGLHIFVRGEAETFKSNAIGVEVFCGSQYFTFTGEHYSGTPTEINEIAPAALKRLKATVDQAKKGAQRQVPPAAPGDERAKVESALAVLSADLGYEEWLHIGMAIHDALGDAGFAVWDYWSSKGSKYPGAKVLESHWKSFHSGGGITAATLFKFAKDAGWRAPRQHAAGAPSSSPRPRPGKAAGSPGNTPPTGSGGGAASNSGGDGGPPPEGLPQIEVRQGCIPEAVDEGEQALLAAPHERIFQRAGFVVRVVKRDRPTVRNFGLAPSSLGLHTLDKPALLELLDRSARWVKWDPKADDGNGGKGDYRRIHCPDKVAEQYLSRVGHWRLPKLWSVISAPTLRPDGSLLSKPGYDEATRSWYDPCGVEYPEIPDKPTLDEACDALEVLKEPFNDFPFTNAKLDLAVALSLALTALVRRSLPSAPLGAISAPVMSSGKTLLADIVAILATGVSAPAMVLPPDDAEAIKTALPLLMEGDPVVLIDNVSRPLEGDWLCVMITQEFYQGRILGRSEMVRVPTTTQWIATGNQIVIAGDLATRTLLCRIDPKSEHPEKRSFKVELREWTAKNRPRLVAAGLTIMRAFLTSGVKPEEKVQPWGRFERWSDMVRAPLVWLGCADPVESLTELESDNPERTDLARALNAWHVVFGDEQKSARDAVDYVQFDPMVGPTEKQRVLRDVLRDIARERGGSGFDPRRLGKWLQHRGGRRIGGRLFVKSGERDHTALWKVETVKDSTDAAGAAAGASAGIKG
jgi:hypothetical protein